MEVLIYSEHSSNRFYYVLEWIFKGVASFKITHNLKELALHEGPSIIYGNVENRYEAIQIPDSGYLWNLDVEPNLPETALVTFPIQTLSADIFTFIFYALTRCEEYTKDNLDSWGRFKAENSLAFKGNYLHIPYVDLVRAKLFDTIKKKWISFEIPLPIFNRQITYDIDVAWAYLYRSFFRHVYGILRDLIRSDFMAIRDRWMVLSHLKMDPFFTFSRLLNIHSAIGDKPIFFFLMGNKSRIDRAVGLKSKAFKQLIRDLSSKYIIGLHPSMRSGRNFSFLMGEYNLLREYAGQQILHSRQHYLLLNLPETYRNLLNIGVRNDYSMGYASKSGFRAGTCFPFHWYDIEKDICTDLTIHPFQAMDVTFWVYGQNTPENVLTELRNLENQVKSVGGTFTLIAHNSSFSGPGTWEKWEPIYFAFLKNENL